MAKSDVIITKQQPLDDGMMVSIHGEIDFSRSPDLRSELLTLLGNKPGRMVLDLSGVPYMDSSGVATLVEVLQIQRKASSKLVLCGLQPKVRGIFEIARLNLVFTIVDNCDTAAKA
ncbi:MAG: STAS domain-containing protein [Phycisphaeraceae bacterium]|nr:STAS domain-containing protein [Phycisphaeraceae bacterium]